MRTSQGTSHSRSTPVALAEINVTPLVDVMLVLLIVFMISAPLMQQGIRVDLPKTNAQAITETPDQLVLVINENRQLFLAETRIEKGSLSAKLKAIVLAKPDIEIAIQADQKIVYGFIAQVMAEVKRAGVQHVGLITEPSSMSAGL